MNRPSVCVYCLKDGSEEITVDHVIARSWYPNTSGDLPKWKAPACRTCNNRYSLIERNILQRLALGFDKDDPEMAAILANVRRSIDPKFGKNPKDAASRASARKSLRANVTTVSSFSDPGVLPYFRGNFALGSREAILVPADDLEALGAKWIRGLHFCELGGVVTAEARLSVHFVSDETAVSAFHEVFRHGRALHRGPGIQVMICDVREEEKRATAFAFRIWREFKLYGFVITGDVSGELAELSAGFDD